MAVFIKDELKYLDVDLFVPKTLNQKDDEFDCDHDDQTPFRHSLDQILDQLHDHDLTFCGNIGSN